MHGILIKLLVSFSFTNVSAQDESPRTLSDLEHDEFLLGRSLWERFQRAGKVDSMRASFKKSQ